MPRLRNSTSGVVVSVSEEYAGRLVGAGWEPVETEKTTAKKASSSKTEK